MADELNTPNHRYHQRRYNVRLAPNEVSRRIIRASGIVKIDRAAIAPLFAGGEVGVWYDPSDLTTLFQDSAGTTPVTAAGQTVGRILDKSGRGNHATQATSAQRPTYGIHPYSGVRNLLVQSNTFSTTWVATNSTRSSAATTSPDGTNNGWLWTRSSTAASYMLQTLTKAAAATTYTGSIYVKKSVGDYFAFRLQGSYPSRVDAVFNLTNGTISSAASVGGTFAGASATIQDAGGGWYRVSLTATSDTATRIQHVISFNSNNVQIDGVDTVANSAGFIYGAQLEAGSSATAYQTVTTQYNITEANVPSVHYIGFDGVDDGMVTSAIDFSATDAVTVFAGVRKLSDATQAIVSELTASSGANTGTFALFAPSIAGQPIYGWRSRGTSTVEVTSTTSFASPNTSVLTSQAKISADSSILRVNGSQNSTNSADQGTGNYANAVLYIGRRGGSSLPFNGNIYSLIVRGAESTAGQITSTETWVNGKTGAY